MKKNLLLIAILSCCLYSSRAEGIKFTAETKWSSILAAAKKENKLIFLDAYASWCGPCKYLQESIFTTGKVGAYFNSNFINVKMDMEEGEGIKLSEQFGLTAYPTLYFVNGNGELVHKSVGAMEADELVELGMTANNPDLQFYTLKTKALNGTLSLTAFHRWVSKATELKESADSVIAVYLSKTNADIFNKEVLQILLENTTVMEESMLQTCLKTEKKWKH